MLEKLAELGRMAKPEEVAADFIFMF